MPEPTTDPTGPAAPGTRARAASRFTIVIEGQTSLVTGANSGIGKAVALGLVASGAACLSSFAWPTSSAECDVRASRDQQTEPRRAAAFHCHRSPTRRPRASGPAVPPEGDRIRA
jgi:hypothetical protein